MDISRSKIPAEPTRTGRLTDSGIWTGDTRLEHVGEIEKRLWSSADNLRANSNFASNEYFLPVMGLIFLRHAYSRFLKVKAEIEPSLPRRGGRPRALTKEDFSRKGAIFLHPEAQFDHLVSLPDSADRAQVIIDAMEKIEKDYETVRGAPCPRPSTRSSTTTYSASFCAPSTTRP